MNNQDLPLFSQTSSQNDLKPLTISELTQKIRGQLEPAFSNILIQGEVSNFRPAASGHLYFSLKDSGSVISVALFTFGGKKKLPFELKDGLQVLCKGKVSVYPPRGSYQFIIDTIEPIGSGALTFAFEQLKEKLFKEGFFDPKNKKQIPAFPKKVAIITSPTGAAIQDMLNVLRRRSPQIEILVVPALVQGDEAPKQLIAGLRAVNRYQLADLIVLARGGGSLEDLWAFNNEDLAREIFNSKIPIISGVGHEVDFSIADFVADLRAPTPSAAAEILSQQWVNVRNEVDSYFNRMKLNFIRELSNKKSLLRLLAGQLINPRDRLREQMQKCDELHQRLEFAMKRALEKRKLEFSRVTGKLEALSPLKVLSRGYSILRKDDGMIIRKASDVKDKDRLRVNLSEGEIYVEVNL